MKRNTIDTARLFIEGLKTRTIHEGGLTEYFPGGRKARYVVGDGTNGVKYTPAEFFGGAADIHGDLRGRFDEWRALGYDGFGTWYDKEGTGLVYVDPVTTHSDEVTALMLAERRGELAIYDIEGGDCLSVETARQNA